MSIERPRADMDKLRLPALPIRWPFAEMKRMSREARRTYVANVERAVESEHRAERERWDRALDETIAGWVEEDLASAADGDCPC